MATLWIDNELVDESIARVSPLDHGILVGDGVFETICVYDRVPFAWRRHYERLTNSAAGLGLSVPKSAALLDAARAVIAANDRHRGRLRITITGGPGPLGSERSGAPETIIVAIGSLPDWPETERCLIVPWRRNEMGATTGLKTISYAENVRALAHARTTGAGEALFLNTAGDLCEATGSNIFLVTDGIIATPPLDSGCLAGVTRALVIDLAIASGLTIVEKPISAVAYREANEAFLTSTTREVQAISQINDYTLTGAPGPVTKMLNEAYTDLRKRECDP